MATLLENWRTKAYGDGLSKAEQEHMRLYRSLDTYKQRTVNTLMESMIENDLLAFRDGCVNEFSYLGRE